jgi:Uma2 family endonuclease
VTNRVVRGGFAPRRFAIDVDQYLRMAELGFFPEGTRVELIEGDILRMAPIGNPHAYAVDELVAMFHRLATAEHVHISSQRSLHLSRYTMPEPDLLLLRPPGAQYRSRAPQASDVLLLVEVASSSLAFDRGLKREIYARHNIAEYWILDCDGAELTVCREPDARRGRYGSVDVRAPGEPVAPAALPAVAIPWERCFGTG